MAVLLEWRVVIPSRIFSSIGPVIVFFGGETTAFEYMSVATRATGRAFPGKFSRGDCDVHEATASRAVLVSMRLEGNRVSAARTRQPIEHARIIRFDAGYPILRPPPLAVNSRTDSLAIRLLMVRRFNPKAISSARSQTMFINRGIPREYRKIRPRAALENRGCPFRDAMRIRCPT